MTQHREDRPVLSQEELANIAANVRNEVPHSGSDQLPEDMRETPHREFDNTTLPQAVEQGLIDTDVQSPASLGETSRETPVVPTEEPAEVTESTAVVTDTPPETVVEPKSKRRRNAVIGGTAAALILSVGGYFATRGNDHTSETTDPNSTPTPSATTSVSPSPTETAPATADSAVDPSIDGSLQPNTEPVVGINFQKLAKQVGDHVDYDSVSGLADTQAAEALRASGSPAIKNFLNEYYDNPNGMASIFNGDQSGTRLLESIYNNTVAFESDFYGNPQGFQAAETPKLIGELSYATHQDIQTATATGNATELFGKLTNSQQANIYKILKSEAAAGNNDPQFATKLAKWTLENRQLPNYSELLPAVAQDYQTKLDALKKDPNTYLPAIGNGKIDDAKVLAVSREIIGGDQATNNDPYYASVKQPQITTMLVELNNSELAVVALVPVPGHTGADERLQAVTVASAQ